MNLLEHLLTCTAEEGGEVSQAAHKALRFGLDDINPKTQRTNRADIVAEFNDLVGVLELLQEQGVELPGLFDREAIESKKQRVRHWLGHSAVVGTLCMRPQCLPGPLVGDTPTTFPLGTDHESDD